MATPAVAVVAPAADYISFDSDNDSAAETNPWAAGASSQTATKTKSTTNTNSVAPLAAAVLDNVRGARKRAHPHRNGSSSQGNDDSDSDSDSDSDIEIVESNAAITARTKLRPRHQQIAPSVQAVLARVETVARTPVPWIDMAAWTEDPAVPARFLHNEIIDFVQYIQPSHGEHQIRRIAIHAIRTVVQSRFGVRSCAVHVHGSHDTQLYLPHADIDIAVEFKGPEMRPALLIRSIHQLAEVLRSKSGEFSRVEAITGARVPIIKVVHTQTGIPIDISFNQLSGIQTADLVRRRMTQFPALRPLVMVLKLFLFCRELNEVFNGGISSYTVITMTLAFLRTHPLVAGGVIRAEENLGTLLLDWFHLYGYVQVPGRTAITESGFVPMFQSGIRTRINPGSYVVVDPCDSANNLTGGARLTEEIRQAFRGAHTLLSQAMHMCKADGTVPKSLIGLILSVHPRLTDRRLAQESLYRLVFPDSDKAKTASGSSEVQQQQQKQRHIRRKDTAAPMASHRSAPMQLEAASKQEPAASKEVPALPEYDEYDGDEPYDTTVVLPLPTKNLPSQASAATVPIDAEAEAKALAAAAAKSEKRRAKAARKREAKRLERAATLNASSTSPSLSRSPSSPSRQAVEYIEILTSDGEIV